MCGLRYNMQQQAWMSSGKRNNVVDVQTNIRGAIVHFKITKLFHWYVSRKTLEGGLVQDMQTNLHECSFYLVFVFRAYAEDYFVCRCVFARKTMVTYIVHVLGDILKQISLRKGCVNLSVLIMHSEITLIYMTFAYLVKLLQFTFSTVLFLKLPWKMIEDGPTSSALILVLITGSLSVRNQTFTPPLASSVRLGHFLWN